MRDSVGEPECRYCGDGKEGMTPELRANSEQLAVIEITMSCGCGGTVRHSIFRCRRCGACYLSSFYEHTCYGSEDEHLVKRIAEEDAGTAAGSIKRCGRPDDPSCRCDIHKGSEFLDNRIKGELRYSKSSPH